MKLTNSALIANISKPCKKIFDAWYLFTDQSAKSLMTLSTHLSMRIVLSYKKAKVLIVIGTKTIFCLRVDCHQLESARCSFTVATVEFLECY